MTDQPGTEPVNPAPRANPGAALSWAYDRFRRNAAPFLSLAAVVGGGFRPTDDGTDFRFNAPDTVHARALADALATAKAEAELHAKALGAHIVRIARVSNRETPITMPEVAAFIVQMDQRKNAWRLVATHSASVAVDYVIAPN
jgi:uncharacterized protein YggE